MIKAILISKCYLPVAQHGQVGKHLCAHVQMCQRFCRILRYFWQACCPRQSFGSPKVWILPKDAPGITGIVVFCNPYEQDGPSH
ncbi:hypothetical protein Plhal304r1_c042g0120961 [Plasmopara halstedii]